ncbi:ATP-binding response regulator [Phytopseudomonas dryadis]|uniref:histidine kinase n=1 Tax=Phytopseudomonas dryadis TaxID=2487520 RepID=A0A4Q9R3P5_9GAMM|nr:hybrid sensor histidine kinase/response regulator [Pseudomonas dryadis]TBU93397.1 hybrid sensor histidine kinase/response regulator [Pseudomonas dryadis]
MARILGAVKDVERSQALVRLLVSSSAVVYVVVVLLMGAVALSQFLIILADIVLFLLVAAVLFIRISRRPGVFVGRRVFAMSCDYFAICVAMIAGGEPLLPLYGLLLWVTVGNGMRFGTRYLLAATAMALVSIGVITWMSPYLHREVHWVLTLVITTVLVPAYAYILLKRSREAVQEARAANLAKSRFLAQASHDLRQPIHSISLFTACLRDAQLGPQEQRMVENIDKSLHSVTQLFRSILDIYTLDNGKVVAQCETVELQGLIDDLLQQHAEAARWASVTLRVHRTRCRVSTDPHLLGIMLQNLVSNALKYAQGSEVLIGCRRRRGALAVEVHDRGRGIAESQLDKVFEEFYRVREDRDRDIEGLGLGLTIVRRLAGLAGLQVSIRSRLGRGTRVSIEGLQLVAAEMKTLGSPRSQPPTPLDGLHVLLIEDDRNVLAATATLLEKWGCQVSTATSIPSANVPCDLVITDFDLGSGASGADCIDYLRELSGRRVPALVMTGHDVVAVQQRVGDVDVPVLAKPVRPAELRSLLSSLRLQLKAAVD